MLVRPNPAPRSFFAPGAGGNQIWSDPEHAMVVLTRWRDPSRLNDVAGKVVAAFAGP